MASKTDKTQHDDFAALRAAKDAAASVTSFEQQMRQTHAALTLERETVANAAPHLDEVLANTARLVDEAAATWAERHAGEAVRTIGGYTDYNGTRERHVKPHLPRNRYGSEPDALGMEDLCGLAPELMKKRLEQVIRNSGVPFGLAANVRAAKLAELDAQIAEVARQHTELVDGAGEVGIVLPLLDVIRLQRDAETRRIARDELLKAERAAGIYGVNV